MSQFYTINEEYSENFKQFEEENFEISTEDLTAKTNLSFNKGRTNLQSTHSYNFLPKNSVFHEIAVTTSSRNAEAKFKQNIYGETEVELNNVFYKNPTLQLGSFFNATLDQGEYRRNFAAKTLLRLFYKNNILASLGIEDWDLVKKSPSVFSSSISYGKSNEKGDIFTFNGYLKYDSNQKLITDSKVYLTRENEKFKGLFEASSNNTLEVAEQNATTPDSNTNATTPVSDATPTATKTVNRDINLGLRFSHQYRENTLIGSAINYNINNKTTDAEVMINQKIDRVNFIARGATEGTLALGVKSNFDGLVVGIGMKSKICNKTTTSQDIEVHSNWVDTRFGFNVEFNRL